MNCINKIRFMRPRNRLLILAALLLWAVTTVGFAQQADSAAAKDSVQPAPAATAAPAAAAPILSDSARKAIAANIVLGRALFEGTTALNNGGPTCISCHNVTAPGMAPGGLLAKDLTHVYGRLGEAGLPPILNSTPFPAMASAYRNKPLEPAEVVALTAFFKNVEQTVPATEPTPDHTWLLAGGSAGIVLWFGLIAAIYFNRKKTSVKKDIFDRQVH
jgi:cytochrome c peroxidase